MADKRATPTIDLTATEVPPAPDTAAPEANSEAKSQTKPASDTWAWLTANVKGPTLAGGVAGAAIMTLVLFALWLTGMVPIRYAGSTAIRARVTALEMQAHELQNRPAPAADTKAIDALNARVARIEESIAKPPAVDTTLTDRVAAAENAMKSLGVALAALNRRSDEAAAQNTIAGIPPAELEALQKRIAALEQSAKATVGDPQVRLAVGAAALRNAAISGASFVAELAQAKSLGADAKALAPLEPFAAAGVPTPAALAQELSALLPVMLKLSGAQAPAEGFLDRLQANAGKIVRIRPVDAPAGDDAAAVLSRIEVAAAHNDIAGALADLAKLPEATRAPAQAWMVKAQARQTALASARALAAEAARALGTKVEAK